MSLVPTAICTIDEARALTARIQSTHAELWSLIAEAHDREAWRALGYQSFSAYVDGELEVSRQHAYRLIDQARVMAAIEAAAPEVSHACDTSARAVQDLKPHLDLLQENVANAVAEAEPEDQSAAARRAVEQTRAAVRPLPAAPARPSTPPAKRRRRPLPDRIRDAGYDLGKAVERLPKLTADDRFPRHRDQVSARLSAQLARAVETCQGLLDGLGTTTPATDGADTRARAEDSVKAKPEERPEHLRGTHHIDPNRVVGSTVLTAAVPDGTFELMEGRWSELDPDLIDGWVRDIAEAITALRKISNNLMKVTR